MHEDDELQRWHFRKKALIERQGNFFFHEREVWLAHLGVNVGSEQNGSGEGFLRPVIIIRKFSKALFWEVPLTTADKQGSRYFQFKTRNGFDGKAIISQLRLCDARRLHKKIGLLSEEEFILLKAKIRQLLA